MRTTVHYELEIPGATPEEMREVEALMRDPNFIEAALADLNALARLHAKSQGMMHPIEITGTIHAVEHK